MSKTPTVRRLVAGFVLLVGSVTQTFAQTSKQPGPAEMLNPKLAPKHEDVPCHIPTPDELATCKVELIKGTVPNSSGWLLRDGKGLPLRRFYDSNGDGKVDIWSYFKDGVEVYREFDQAYKGTPNNFRWLNTGGMKWGVGGVDPQTGRGYIEAWRMISAEEVGQEAFMAVATRDFARLNRLFINDQEIQALKLSAASMQRIGNARQLAQKNFAAVTAKVNLKGAQFHRVDGFPASCVLDESAGGETSVVKYLNRPVLYEINKDHKWLHTGPIIQVGMAWRLVTVPSDIDPLNEIVDDGGRTGGDPEVQKLINAISKLDERPPQPGATLAKIAAVDAYYRARISLVQKIIPLDKASERDTWYKQLFDNIASMAQNSGDPAAIKLLNYYKDDQLTKNPQGMLAAYGVFRVLYTQYALDMVTYAPKDRIKIQERWIEQLNAFVKKYAKADDTPEALWQLAVNTEFSGQDQQAKGYYTRLFEDFPKNEHAARSRGSVARLNLPGNVMKLTAPLLYDPSKLFDVAQFKGKVVIVHYWASYNDGYANDFGSLKRVLAQVGPGVELVAVNLDDTVETAKAALKSVNVTATHLFQMAPNNVPGGLNSPLATQYGIHMLPTMFMVDREGRVTSRSLQIGDIETELKRVK